MINLGTGKLGFSRATAPPAVWNGASLDGQYCLVVAWYGNGGTSDNVGRRVFSVIDDVAAPTGGRAMDVVVRGPTQGGDGAVAVSMNRAAGNLRSAVISSGAAERCEADRHYLAIVNIDAGNASSADDTFELLVFEEGAATPITIGASNFPLNDGVEALSATSRLVVGSPSAAGGNALNDALSSPILACFMRRGTIGQAAAEALWATPGGPRIKDFLGEPQDAVFIYGQGATGGDENALPNPVADATGACSAWFDGDTETYATWLQSVSSTLHDSDVYNAAGESTAGVSLAHMHETGRAWSGFWQKSPPESPLGLAAVAGVVPTLKGVIDAAAIPGSPAAIAACTGNSRWANSTEAPAGIGSSATCNRNHAAGLRLARPGYDGGFYLPDLSAAGSYPGVILPTGNTGLDASSADILGSDWTRFSFHGSSTSLPGNGRPAILAPAGDATVRYTATHPAEATRHGALLLNYPGGGAVELRLNTAASGTGAGTTTTPAPVSGSAAVDTDTSRGTVTVTSVSGTTTTVNSTLGILPGDALHCATAGAVGGIAIVESIVNATQVVTRHAWADEPAGGETLSVGPVSYTFVELPHAGDAASPDRGVRFVHQSGGAVVIVMTGYRESARGERLCYIPMGRGGLGYTSQASRMATASTFEDILGALGAACVFAGLATQDGGRIESTLLPNDASDYEILGTPDVVNSSSGLDENPFATQHGDLRDLALARQGALYAQIQDTFGSLIDQGIALQRLDAAHPNGRGMLDAGDAWWSLIEASPELLLSPPVSGGRAARTARNRTASVREIR